MARHSHWAQIKLKKGALDKKRGKIFTRHAHLIEVAARQAGGDPNMNASLRLAVENARADNMPRENIDRAIKKGTGELKGAELSQEITYEAYGPGGIALVIDTLTDNKNRTSQFVKTALQKHGGSLGSIGSTSFLFETKGVIAVKEKAARDSDELELIDAGAEDIEEGDGVFILYTRPNELGTVKSKLQEKSFVIESAEVTKVPKNTIQIADSSVAKKILALVSALEDEDDVSNVAANFEMSEN